MKNLNNEEGNLQKKTSKLVSNNGSLIDKNNIIDSQVQKLETVSDKLEASIPKQNATTNVVTYDKIAPSDSLIEIESKIRNAVKFGYTLTEPLLHINGSPLLRKGTIVTIQGQKGTHKTRVATKIAKVLLRNGETSDSIGMTKSTNEEIVVAFVNSEMAEFEEFLPIVNDIITGSSITADDENFKFTSIRNVSRHERINKLYNYLTNLRKGTEKHLVVIIDVVTDLLLDFNDPKETNLVHDSFMKFSTFFDCSIIAVIHENPGTNKARGHFGTEIGNKSASQIRISIEYKNYVDTGRLRLEFPKVRDGKPKPLFLKYSEDLNDLVIDTSISIGDNKVDPEIKKSLDICKILSGIMKEERDYPQQELIEELQKVIGGSINTLKTRLNTIIREKLPIFDNDNRVWNLVNKTPKMGGKTFYSLEYIDAALDDIAA